MITRLAIFVSILLIFTACQSNNQIQNQNSGTANVSTSEKELPPGFSTSPLPIQGSTPGIPDPNTAKEIPKGTTPTPGIPDVKELNKPFKPGKTPTPGIPSPEEIKRQLNTPVDPNVVNQAPSTNQPATKEQRKTQKKPGNP